MVTIYIYNGIWFHHIQNYNRIRFFFKFRYVNIIIVDFFIINFQNSQSNILLHSKKKMIPVDKKNT